MTSHRDSHTTTDVEPEMLSGAQTGYGVPLDNVKYAAFPVRKYIENMTFFHAKPTKASFTYI